MAESILAPLIFIEVDLYIILFKQPKRSLKFIVYTWILYETLCVLLPAIFIMYCMHAHGSTVTIY